MLISLPNPHNKASFTHKNIINNCRYKKARTFLFGLIRFPLNYLHPNDRMFVLLDLPLKLCKNRELLLQQILVTLRREQQRNITEREFSMMHHKNNGFLTKRDEFKRNLALLARSREIHAPEMPVQYHLDTLMLARRIKKIGIN